MFAWRQLVDNLPHFTELLSRRGLELDKSHILQLEDKRKKLQIEKENTEARRNSLAKEIGNLAKQNPEAIKPLKAESSQVKQQLEALSKNFEGLEKEIRELLIHLPNLPLESTPIGRDESANLEVKKIGQPREQQDWFTHHTDIIARYSAIDTLELARNLCGSRFSILTGQIARLNRALSHFMLEQHTQQGYLECNLPVLVNQKTMFGTGQLPKFADDLFHIQNHDLLLIPTAEVVLTNYFQDCIIKEQDLPQKLVAHTQCFRQESGSYGRDTKGILRQHQFEKVELVHLVKAEDGLEHLELMLKSASSILDALELPYRIVELCTGDLGFSARKTYDIEVWLPSETKYREISSCSYCGDFQARRMNSRYKTAGSSSKTFIHTLNGSALAIGRTLIAVLENYQNTDGSVAIPQVLQPYFGGKKTL